MFCITVLGLCLEKITPQSSSKYALAEWIEQIKHCYETASDLGLLYLQQQSNKQHSLNVLTSTVGGKLTKVDIWVGIISYGLVTLWLVGLLEI